MFITQHKLFMIRLLNFALKTDIRSNYLNKISLSVFKVYLSINLQFFIIVHFFFTKLNKIELIRNIRKIKNLKRLTVFKTK